MKHELDVFVGCITCQLCGKQISRFHCTTHDKYLCWSCGDKILEENIEGNRKTYEEVD